MPSYIYLRTFFSFFIYSCQVDHDCEILPYNFGDAKSRDCVLYMPSFRFVHEQAIGKFTMAAIDCTSRHVVNMYKNLARREMLPANCQVPRCSDFINGFCGCGAALCKAHIISSTYQSCQTEISLSAIKFPLQKCLVWYTHTDNIIQETYAQYYTQTQARIHPHTR